MRIFPIFALLALQAYSNSNHLIENEDSNVGIRNSYFWKLQLWYTKNNDLIQINIISNYQHSANYSNFVNDFTAGYYEYNTYMKPIIIKRYSFNLEKIPLKFVKNNFKVYNGSDFSDELPCEESKVITEPRSFFYVIVWNAELLINIINRIPIRIMFKPSSVFLIVLIEQFTKNCSFWESQIYTVLRNIWAEFSVMTVMVASPCSEKLDNIIWYEPFYTNGLTRGRICNLDVKAAEYYFRCKEHSHNLQGYPFRISMFQRIPTAIKDNYPKYVVGKSLYKNLNKSGGYLGLDGCVLGEIADILNLTTIVTAPEDNHNFGHKSDNGTFVGSLGEVVYKQVDISANGRFLMSYETDEIEFTAPVNNDLLCFIVPKAQRIPQWSAIFRCFAFNTWLTILGFFLIALFIWILSTSREHLSKSALIIYSIFISTPTNLFKLPQRLFLSSCLIFAIIINGIFQGTLVRSYSTTSYYPDIDTLEQLDQSGLNIYTSLSLFNNDTSQLINHLRSKVVDLDGTALDRVATFKNLSALERKHDANFFIDIKYIDSDNTPLLHLVNECPVNYFVSYILPKGSPFLEYFNHAIYKFSEMGLLDKWYNDFVDGFIEEKLVKNTQIQRDNSYTLQDVQVAFWILGAGMILSTVVFILEMVCKKNNAKFHFHRGL